MALYIVQPRVTLAYNGGGYYEGDRVEMDPEDPSTIYFVAEGCICPDPEPELYAARQAAAKLQHLAHLETEGAPMRVAPKGGQGLQTHIVRTDPMSVDGIERLRRGTCKRCRSTRVPIVDTYHGHCADCVRSLERAVTITPADTRCRRPGCPYDRVVGLTYCEDHQKALLKSVVTAEERHMADAEGKVWAGIAAVVSLAGVLAFSVPAAVISLTLCGAGVVAVRVVNERAARRKLEAFYEAHPDRRPPRPAPTMNPGIGSGYYVNPQAIPAKPPPPPAPPPKREPPQSRFRGK